MLSIGDAARGSFEFDCVDAEFADGVDGAIDQAFEEGVTKPFAIIRIVTTPGRFKTVAGGPGIPGAWFALEVAPASTAESLPTWHSQLQPNGYTAHARGVTSNITYLGTDGPAEPRGPRPQSVGAAVATHVTVPSALLAACTISAAPSSAPAISQALGSVAKVASVRVRDVGQASFSSLSKATADAIGDAALALQSEWESLRQAFREAGQDLNAAKPDAKLARFDKFWLMSESQFTRRAFELLGDLTSTQLSLVRAAHRKAKGAVDERWHLITEADRALEDTVRKAYRVSDRVYDAVIDRAPIPSIAWALRP